MINTNIKGVQVVIWYNNVAGHERTKSLKAGRVCGAGDGCHCTPPKVSSCKYMLGFVLPDTLHVVTPFPCQFVGGLPTLDSYIEIDHPSERNALNYMYRQTLMILLRSCQICNQHHFNKFIYTRNILTSIHWKDFVIAEQVSDVLGELSQYIGVESSGGECHDIGLLFEGVHNPGMTVSLVTSTVSAEEVIVTVSFHIPHMDTCNRESTCTPM